MELLRATLRGAVRGGKESLLSHVASRYSRQLVTLDQEVTSCRPGQQPPWWKQKVHGLLPKSLLDFSFYEQAFRPRAISTWSGMKPAYGTIGNKVPKGGYQCIDERMGKPAGEQDLPRMVRTPDGREILHRKFIEELEASLKDVKEMGDACHFFFRQSHLIVTNSDGERFQFKDIRRTPNEVARKFKGIKTGEYPGELKDESTTSS
jgi:hypothetical protein